MAAQVVSKTGEKESVIGKMTGTGRGVIDRGALERLRRLGGTDLIGRMIELFISHIEPLISQAYASLESGDREILERAAHSIKSSAANLGAFELRSTAEQLEELAPAGDRARLQVLTAELDKAFREAKSSLLEEGQ